MSNETKGAILFKSRYGATAQYARWLGDRLALPVFDIDAGQPDVTGYDYLLIGTSVYMGKMLVKRWLLDNSHALHDKALFLFVVCATPDSETDRQQKIIDDNVPGGLIYDRRIFFMPGRLVIAKLSRLDRFFLRLGARLEKDKEKRAAMQHDLDGTDPAHLDKLCAELERVTRSS